MSATSFQPSPGFKGLWIPACILFDGELPLIQKMILSEVYHLQQNDGRECFAGNAHFCALTGCKERNLRNHLSSLQEAGLLSRYTPVKGRKMAVCSELEKAIDGDSREPISRTIRQLSAAPNSSETASVRQSTTVVAAKNDSSPASERRVTRQPIATEYTGRKQQEDTTENTTGVGDFSKFIKKEYASTHHLNEQGEPIVSKETWKRWRRMLRQQFDEPAKSSKRQLAILNRMVGFKFDAEAVMREAIDDQNETFWECPPARLLPPGVKQEHSFDRDERGVYVV